jgi:hypothetical protein
MSRPKFSPLVLLAVLAILAGMLVSATPAAAQNTETVKIVTADGVKLHAIFYPSDKKNAPTVLMLHPIGEGKSSKTPEWKSLAEALQKGGYAVLMFDFRGHGDSTTIDDAKVLFWSKKINLANVKTKDPDAIDVKDYIKSGSAYLPVLVNDIAAARAWLDRRNDDSKDCNTSSLIVIGADQGATLGAVWMNAEWHRHKYTPPAFMMKADLSKTPEGKDIIGAVFLSIQPALDKRTISVSKLLKIACKDNGTAATFIYGKEDAKAGILAKSLEKELKVKGSKKHDLIAAGPVDTNLSGIKLLQKGLGTEKAIIDYLDGFKEDRGSERVERDFLSSLFMWRMGPAILLPAKNKKGEKTLNFDDYNKFVQ